MNYLGQTVSSLASKAGIYAQGKRIFILAIFPVNSLWLAWGKDLIHRVDGLWLDS